MTASWKAKYERKVPTAEQATWSYSRVWNNGTNVPAPPTSTYSNAVTEWHYLGPSQGNAYHKLGKSSGRIGGDFTCSHLNAVSFKPTPYFYAREGSYRIRGPISVTQLDYPETHYAAGGNGSYPGRIYSLQSDLEAFGTTAIANVEPTNPLSGLAVALGELKREGLPSLPGVHSWRDRTARASSAGSEYLNKEFGWDPLIGEIRSAMNVTRNVDRLIEQYSNGSGKRIHREFFLPTERNIVSETSGQDYVHTYPMPPANLYITPPKWTRTETIEKTRWFSGCFTYHLPAYKIGGSNFERNRRLAYKLYGVGITPEVVWDLTPWTWAVDWVSNAGDVFHNIGAFADNGLVMHYGYVMETIVHRLYLRTYDIRTKTSEQVGEVQPQRMECSATLESVTKVRRVASPYGFGLTFDGFSPFQVSVLAALGISRSG